MGEKENELLRERYGQKPELGKRTRLILGSSALALMSLGAIALGLANFSPIEAQDVGFRVIDPTAIELDFEITKPGSQVAICSVEALNEQFAQVGYKEIEVGPTETNTVRLTVRINTTELATTALVDNCELR
ncbi:MAG: hypothetical protein RL068_878 [Actinomycetota bacterium]